MNEQRADQSGTGKGVPQERCLCCEVLDLVRARLGVSPRVRQHLENSRIELLKAVRQVIDDRIEHLSQAAQPGTRIRVE
jgi:hypothetical protein